jgi:hypothetical protein
MHRLRTFSISFLLGAALAAMLPVSARAQEQFQFESDLLARRRVFESVGAGFRAIRRGPNGNYYILTAPAPAVVIYDSMGKRLGQIPSESAAKGAALVYGESFDVDRDGRVAVADRGANAVKIYTPNGTLAGAFSIPAPVSIVFLSGGEIAVTRAGGERLITTYDLAGNVVRDFGEREQIADEADINNQVNFGHLASDPNGNAYFAFDYLPEPTVRKFDQGGNLAMEISLTTLEFEPAAQAARKAIARSETGIPSLHRIISAVGVDPVNEDVWMAVGTLLMHFDKEGVRIASFRTFTPGGGRLEPSVILVEPDRLLIGADPQGTYEFPKPAKLPQ